MRTPISAADEHGRRANGGGEDADEGEAGEHGLLALTMPKALEDEDHGDHGADHEDVEVGEVDEFGDAVDEGEARGRGASTSRPG